MLLQIAKKNAFRPKDTGNSRTVSDQESFFSLLAVSPYSRYVGTYKKWMENLLHYAKHLHFSFRPKTYFPPPVSLSRYCSSSLPTATWVKEEAGRNIVKEVAEGRRHRGKRSLSLPTLALAAVLFKN